MAHILLIEPDRLLAHTYYEVLRAAGYAVTVCASAQQAIMAADEVKPDVVILEMQLVEHSGVEFLYELRSYADWQNLPLIIHTQVPSTEFAGSREVLIHELGASVYLYKPQTSLKKLLRAVGELVPVTAAPA